jgi:predicted XRE-type DNA-binding protein
MQRPINRERHSLITDTQSNMTIKLIQPQISWLRNGPCDENGAPYGTAEYNIHNVNEVFSNVVGKMVEMQSDAYRDSIQKKMLVKLSIVDMIQTYKTQIAMLKAEISHNIDVKLNVFPGRISKVEAMEICRSELKDLAFMF